jgi:hypothetical protein
MKKIFLLVASAITLLTTPNYAQSPGWTNAFAMGAGDFDFCRGIGADNTGNIYIGGLFSATIDFQPGPGISYGASTGTIDFYIASYTNNGTLRWLRTMGGTGTSIDMGAVTTDANGNVYTTGYFLGSIDFDGTTGTDIHSSAAGAFDIFITKYDSSGNYQFTLTFPGTSLFNKGEGISVDATGAIYLCGYFSGVVDFDPGNGQATLTGAGLRDIFITKYSSTGTFQWVKQIGNADNQTAYDIATSNDGHLYLTGSYEGSLDFNPGPGISNFTTQGNTDIFILKLDTAGNYIWNKRIGDTDIDEGQKIALGNNGELYVTGYFGWFTDFDPGSGTATLSSAGSDDIFILKLDTAGNYHWARSIGSSNLDEGVDIATGANGDVYTYAVFRDAADVDPGTGTVTFTPIITGYSDLMLVCLDSTGTYKWAEQIGGDYNEYGGSICITGTGAVWVSGDFFSPGFTLGTQNLLNIDPFGTANDIFFARLGGSSTTQGFSETADQRNYEVYPNPASTEIHLKGLHPEQPAILTILDLAGKMVMETTTESRETVTLPLNALQPGIYLLQIQQGTTKKPIKIVVQ